VTISLFPSSELKTCRLLDAGAGVGALSCAFLDRWINGDFQFQEVQAYAYEIDDRLRGHLEEHLAAYDCVTTHVSAEDFISSSNQLLFHGATDYTHAILNHAFKDRQMPCVPIVLSNGKLVCLSKLECELIRAIIEDFAPRFAPGSVLVYAGDTGEKWGYFDEALLTKLGVTVNAHGKMPDVVLHFKEENWLLLVESVTRHGPVDGKRHAELSELFAGSKSGLVYVTAFPNRAIMGRYLDEIAWETEVWVADAPSHPIHFNGERFLGPYSVE